MNIWLFVNRVGRRVNLARARWTSRQGASVWGAWGLALFLMACEKPKPPVAGPRPALVKTISQQGANETSAITGEVRARYESAQGFRVAGKILVRKVEVGQPVKKGQVLAQLDTADASLNVQANQADIAAAEAALHLAQSNLERQRQLIDKKFISAASLDSFEAQYKAAQARVQQTKAVASVSGNQRAYTTLMADRDGVVSEIRAEPGQVVAAGEVIARIIDPTALEVHIPVPENRMASLAVGDEAVVRLWAKSEVTYPAVVREIAPTADTVTRAYSVKVTLLNPDKDVRIGMTAGVRITKLVSDAMLVPSPAVVERNHQTVVWKVGANQTVHPYPVRVGSFREDGALVTEGVAIGDKIVVAGASVLVDGQTIRPIEVRE